MPALAPKATVIVAGAANVPLAAFMVSAVNVSAPAVVGVPDKTPAAGFNVNPGGRLPLETANIAAGSLPGVETV